MFNHELSLAQGKCCGGKLLPQVLVFLLCFFEVLAELSVYEGFLSCGNHPRSYIVACCNLSYRLLSVHRFDGYLLLETF